jgi:hypothetical protein
MLSYKCAVIYYTQLYSTALYYNTLNSIIVYFTTVYYILNPKVRLTAEARNLTLSSYVQEIYSTDMQLHVSFSFKAIFSFSSHTCFL